MTIQKNNGGEINTSIAVEGIKHSLYDVPSPEKLDVRRDTTRLCCDCQHRGNSLNSRTCYECFWEITKKAFAPASNTSSDRL